MESRWWFWRGEIQSDEHARAVLDFAAAVFGVMAALEIFELSDGMSASLLLSAAIFGSLAILLKYFNSRAAAVALIVFCGQATACFALKSYISLTAGDLDYILWSSFLLVIGLCVVVAWRALVAATYLHRRRKACGRGHELEARR